MVNSFLKSRTKAICSLVVKLLFVPSLVKKKTWAGIFEQKIGINGGCIQGNLKIELSLLETEKQVTIS